MWRSMNTSLVTAALLLGSAALAGAADFCLDNQVVLKAFSPPGHGACKEYRGVRLVPGDHFVSGAVCGSSDSLTITFTHLMVGDDIRSQRITLERATLKGTFTECKLGNCCIAPRNVARTACDPSAGELP